MNFKTFWGNTILKDFFFFHMYFRFQTNWLEKKLYWVLETRKTKMVYYRKRIKNKFSFILELNIVKKVSWNGMINKNKCTIQTSVLILEKIIERVKIMFEK